MYFLARGDDAAGHNVASGKQTKNVNLQRLSFPGSTFEDAITQRTLWTNLEKASGSSLIAYTKIGQHRIASTISVKACVSVFITV